MPVDSVERWYRTHRLVKAALGVGALGAAFFRFYKGVWSPYDWILAIGCALVGILLLFLSVTHSQDQVDDRPS